MAAAVDWSSPGSGRPAPSGASPTPGQGSETAPAGKTPGQPRQTGGSPALTRIPTSNVKVLPLADRLETPSRLEAAVPVGGASTSSVVARPILFFDDKCKVCSRISRWVIASDARGQNLIDERPIGHDPAALVRLHPSLDIWKMYEAVHVLLPWVYNWLAGSGKTAGA
jgi:hypothetical protein